VSGIVGIFNKGDRCAPRIRYSPRVRHPIAPQVLEQMLQTLAHRGPDGSKIWQGDAIGLGHCMLWTTPESLKEVLPYRHAAADLVITADARIDNRAELLNALALDVANASAISDSEIILAAYQKWGQDCPSQLLGDFAFAIWDSRKQTLFCARDHFGIKPFYYCDLEQYFIFASEIKALLSVPEVSRQLNERRISDYFLEPMLESKTDTLYEEIFRLPPAHWVNIAAAPTAFNPRCYWSLDCTASVTMLTDAEYAAAFKDIFFEAVRCRLRSAFPVGSHLSGGLDSSAITCVANELLRQSSQTLHTFSNIFDRISSCDEREYFNVVLEQGHYIPHFIEADRLGPLSEWQNFFQYFDEPFFGPSHFLVRGLNHATQKAGVRICLDGFDGDTVVSHGASYFAELAQRGDWETFIAEAKAVSKHFDTSPEMLLMGYAIPYLSELAQRHHWLTFAKRAKEISQAFTVSRRKLWIQYGLKPLLPRWALDIFRIIKYGSALDHTQSTNQSNRALNSTFLRRTNNKRLVINRKLKQRRPRSAREEQYQDLTSGAFTHVLELSDQGASAFSIEIRHPFMDKRLVEFCLALPPDQKLKLGWSRMIMRRAMEGVLPTQIQWRGGKASMEENFKQGLIGQDKAIVEGALFGNSNNAQYFLDLEFLQQAFQALQSEPNSPQAAMMAVWKGTALSLWLQHQRH
jgi:asparagine synthase (glutamine-hydrolysing)